MLIKKIPGTNEPIQRALSNLRHVYVVGDTIQTSKITFKVETVQKDERGEGPLVPKEDYEFIIPTIQLHNQGEKEFDFIPLLHMYVKDDKGNVYPITAVPTQTGQFSGIIPARDSIREEIGFEVPKNTSQLILYFTPGISSGEIIMVKIWENDPWWKF